MQKAHNQKGRMEEEAFGNKISLEKLAH